MQNSRTDLYVIFCSDGPCEIFGRYIHSLWMYRPNLKSVALPVLEIIAIEVLCGVANPQSWWRGLGGGHRGSGMPGWYHGIHGTVRTSVSEFLSYRPSIVTFPLSLRVSEILPLLCSSTPLFPTPPLVSPKFPHVPLGIGRWPLGYEERSCWDIILRAVSFQDFQPMWSWSTNVTDGQTTGEWCDRKTALCTKVHRAVKIRHVCCYLFCGRAPAPAVRHNNVNFIFYVTRSRWRIYILYFVLPKNCV